MTVIDDFLHRYVREFDFFQEAARLCSQRCDTALRQNGIRAIVGFRAKTRDRLEEKLRKRDLDRHYTSTDDIYSDLVDLAGVRIALYFPGDLDIVEQLIYTNLSVDKAKIFPRDSRQPAYEKRFSGYWARHYRVRLPASELSEESRRYAETSIEIQVASVLIHAWAEVEHDLVYKPISGRLSEEEYAILDELNGLVLAGEIALQRLQKAGNLRFDRGGDKFNNHYELAKYIYERIAGKTREPIMGRVDVLFQFLQLVSKDTSRDIDPYLNDLDEDTERHPLVDQIVDRILAQDPALYQQYAEAQREASSRNPYDSPKDDTTRVAEYEKSLGNFISSWVSLEKRIRSRAKQIGGEEVERYIPLSRLIREFGGLSEKELHDFITIVNLRNETIHGIATPEPEQLNEAARVLEEIANSRLPRIGSE